MNFKKMFEMQKELDDRIRIEHNLEGQDLINKKILAFQVELGELANETRCFKYWSLKPPSEKKIILEEYVDGVHFLLSIGLDLQNTSLKYSDISSELNDLTNQFCTLFQLSSELLMKKEEKNFISLFNNYLLLGKLLQFSTTDIEKAYIGKNEVNHQRQNEGY